MNQVIDTATSYLMNTYGRFPIVMDYGEGVYVYDTSGKKYLDMCAGIAVNSLGYNHPKLTKALQNQVEKLCHISNLYFVEPQQKAAQLLVENSEFSKVFFCNSGAEANEAAIKLARKNGKAFSPNKTKIISMKQSFHGRTYGALSATGQPHYQQSFLPLLEGFGYVEYNNIEALEEMMNPDVCGLLIEVIQGEGGIVPGDPVYLKQVEELCKQYHVILIIDEVQTGIGRCGSLFAHENVGLKPDIITLAKGLGGGVPIGAMLCREEVNLFVPGDHATTFGGNPLVTTAAKVVLEEVINGGIIEHVKDVGSYLEIQLNLLKERFSCITDVRGKCLMQGIELNFHAGDLATKCMEKGMLVVGAGKNVLRFVPPLIIKKAEIDECIHILTDSLEEIQN